MYCVVFILFRSVLFLPVHIPVTTYQTWQMLFYSFWTEKPTCSTLSILISYIKICPIDEIQNITKYVGMQRARRPAVNFVTHVVGMYYEFVTNVKSEIMWFQYYVQNHIYVHSQWVWHSDSVTKILLQQWFPIVLKKFKGSNSTPSL